MVSDARPRSPSTSWWPPSDISRTKPLVRLVLNQIGPPPDGRIEQHQPQAPPYVHARRIPRPRNVSTSLKARLAFMAGYGLKAFLIAQSLNQIEKAYGPEQRHPGQLPMSASPSPPMTSARRSACPTPSGTTTELARDEELCRPPPVTLARAI